MSLPNGWTQHRLREIALINPSREIVHNLNLLVSFVPMEDVSESAKIKGTKVRNYKNVSKGYTPFQNGDILVAKITPCFENGKGALAENLSNGLGFGSTEFHVIRAKEEYIDKKYLYFSTLSHEFRRRGEINMQGSAGQQRVPTDFLASYPVILPPLPEQRKIADILSTWDEAIDLTDQMIMVKQKRKQTIMQRLLTGKLRFPGFINSQWHPTQLKEFLNPVVRKIEKPQESYIALSVRSHGKGAFIRIVEDPEEVAMTELYKVDGGDLIVNITFAWEGAIAIVDKEHAGCLVSHRFPTYNFDEAQIVPNFFRYVMVTKRFFHELGIISPGGAGRNRVLNKTDFLKIQIQLPNIAEQRKIAEFLVNCDQEITLLQQKLAILRQQKKGLMQQLLTGKIRVKI